MMLHVALVAEILATVICIYCIYGRKVEWDVKTVGAVLGILIILEISNFFHLGGMFSVFGYIILFIYCKSKFQGSILETVISLLLNMIMLTSMQFICISLVNTVISEKQLVRNAISNLLVLLICAGILPKCGLHRLQKSMLKRSRQIVLLLGFICVIIVLLLLQEKLFYKIQMQYFIFAVPAILMLLYLLLKWCTAQTEADRMEEEIQRAEESAEEYENLLMKVRLRQHEFKNHMAAVFSAHYTHKTYENLVQAQEEYCKRMMEENKYNNLLLLGNKILAGYLYGKFQECEEDGIVINYKVAARMEKSRVAVYYVIEMLGILLDNAVESLKDSEYKTIFFEAAETKEGYEFCIRNPYIYVSYDEILEWFLPGKSGKGSGRGLGLYHLKCLCEEWGCDIGCRNAELEQHNWIVFTLKIGKTDNR